MSRYGLEMCAHPGYDALMRDWECSDAYESALERQAALERADLERLAVAEWLAELPELGRPALARALRMVIEREAERRAEATLSREAEAAADDFDAEDLPPRARRCWGRG